MVECGDWVHLDAPLLEEDLDQSEPDCLAHDAGGLKDDSKQDKEELSVGGNGDTHSHHYLTRMIGLFYTILEESQGVGAEGREDGRDGESWRGEIKEGKS